MTESTWHASCLKHRCLVAMVAFTGMEPAYHRVNGADGCTCPPETLVIHHMNHSPLDALKDAELQIDELGKALSALYEATSDCTKHSCRGLRNGDVALQAHLVLRRTHENRKCRDCKREMACDLDSNGRCPVCARMENASQQGTESR